MEPRDDLPRPWRMRQREIHSTSSINIQGSLVEWLVAILLGAVLAMQFWIQADVKRLSTEVSLVRAYLADYDNQKTLKGD